MILGKLKNKFIKKIISSCVIITILGMTFPTTVWGFFTDIVSTGKQTISTASYNIIGYISGNGETININNNLETNLLKGKYTISLNGNGSASTGYCKIVINGVEYYTQQIENNKEFKFNLNLEKTTEVKINSSWGTYSNVDGKTLIINNGDSIVNEEVIKPSEETITKPGNEEVMKPSEETITKPGNEEVIKPSEETITKPGNEEVIKPSEETITKPGNEEVMKPSEETITKPGNEETTKPSEETITKPGNEEDIIE